ncbi:hypothetical protein [Streptacidiphilus rugosus]|uniref:hypothetical protein n=1 Tax=Streptacidiphilus rugosus TaxID=405783 RepID=UPI0012F919B6|nr:hypothetical protein [Streptacidiphilus rugosus]
MDDELSPEEALAVAAATRRTAAVPRVPGWFPVYAGGTFALAMAAIGVSDLAGRRSAAAVLGIAGLVLLVAHLGMYAEIVRRWRRGGLVPLTDICRRRTRRRVSQWLVFVGCALGFGFFAAGSLGWGTISFGLILGLETWYRISGSVRPR